MQRQRWLPLVITLLLAALAATPTWARPAPPEPSGNGPAPTAQPTAAPAEPTPTITPVQLPAVGGSDAAPAATAAPPTSCPTFTGASSDFSTFYVKCGETADTYYGPGGAKNGGSVGPGTYTVQNDRRCFAGSVELNCETFQGGVQPNWFLLEAGWVTNGVEYRAPSQAASAATPASAPAAPANTSPTKSGSFTYNVGYYNYLTSSTSEETQSTPGSVTLSSGSGYVSWQVTENGRVIQGPTTFVVQAGTTGFNIYWTWPAMPVNEGTSLPDAGEDRPVSMTASLYSSDGTLLATAPTITVSYQYQPPLGPGPTPEPGHSDPRD